MSARSKGEETRAKILAAALECFREKGFEQTTMRDISASAGMALGAAYYYFPSKDAIVLAFYQQAQQDTTPSLEAVIAESEDLATRLKKILLLKLEYFAPSKKLLGALAAHSDPGHPLSPFSPETREIREKDMDLFERAVDGSSVKVKKDLAAKLPGILWMYQMGVILFWIYDNSPEQRRTQALIDKSLHLVIRLLQVSSLPLMSPMRKLVLDLVETIVAEDAA